MFTGPLSTSSLKHKPDIIKKLFSNVGDSIVAKGDLTIVFPDRYVSKGLAVMGSTINLLAVFAIIDTKGNYGVVSAPVIMGVSPDNVRDVLIDGDLHKAVEVRDGSVVVANRNLLKQEGFMYDLFDEFFLQGRVPWYLTYDMLSDMFSEARKYAGSKIGNDPLAMEIVTAIVSRDPDNKTVSYREYLSRNKGKAKAFPEYVGISNVYYSYNNTLAKVMGGYMQQGITTAIVHKEDKTSKVSGLLRA